MGTFFVEAILRSFVLSFSLICLSALAATAAQADDGIVCAAEIDPSKSLLITDLSVIDSQDAKAAGALSFKAVVSKIFANHVNASAATESWFDEWSQSEALGVPVLPRSQGLLLGLWPRLPSGALDLDQSPFRLLAVVYRPDLTSLETPNGEGRFIFGAFNPHDGSPIDFTVIFEFALPDSDAASTWAASFASLSSLSFGETYRQQLIAITQRFVKAESLAQVRTNDFYLGPEWELREFRLSPEAELAPALTARTPDLKFDRQGDADTLGNDLLDWISENRDSILQEKHTIPERFLAVGSIAFDDHFKWFAGNPAIPEDVRHALAVNTCNGCHSGETGTRFLHVSPRREGVAPEISAYLTAQMPKRQKVVRSLLCGESVP